MWGCDTPDSPNQVLVADAVCLEAEDLDALLRADADAAAILVEGDIQDAACF